MPGYVLHAGATVLCAHGGQASPTAPSPRVQVGGQPVTTLSGPYAVAGCPFNVPGAPVPCVTAQWTVGADPGPVGRRAAAAPGQPGDLRPERDAGDHRRHPGPGQGGLR